MKMETSVHKNDFKTCSLLWCICCIVIVSIFPFDFCCFDKVMVMDLYSYVNFSSTVCLYLDYLDIHSNPRQYMRLSVNVQF